MPRRKVSFRAGEYYHVYNRGVNRGVVFFERENYLFFLRKLRQLVVCESQTDMQQSRPAADIIAYCLMPNHYHLLVKLNENTFSKRMQSFTQSYTNAINKQRGRVGPLFQGRFQAVHVEQREYLLHLTRYIHLNAVDAGIVRLPEKWEFSSYLDYTGSRMGTLPRVDVVMSEFDSSMSYREFVESAIGHCDRTIRHLIFAE